MVLDVLWHDKRESFALINKFFKLLMRLTISHFEFLTERMKILCVVVMAGRDRYIFALISLVDLLDSQNQITI